MKANILQRLLLYAVILPLALLTFVWYLISVIASFDQDAAINIGQSGLGPIEEEKYEPYGTVFYPGGGVGSVGSYYGYTTATVTRTGARSTYGTYMTLGSVLTWNTLSVSSPITRLDGDVIYYTHGSLRTSYSPSTMTQYGYITTTGVFTDTTTSAMYKTFGGRALGSEATQPTPSRGESVAAGPTATPTPALSVTRTPPQKRAAPPAEELPQRHELVKRRRGGGGGGGSGSSVDGEKVKVAFLVHVPNFLGLFWAAVTITWLLLRLCVGPMRTIAAEKGVLGWLSIIGLVSTLYSTIVMAVSVGELGTVWTGLMVCILVFSWLLLCALAGTWLWEHMWAKRHAYGQLHLSMAEHVESPPPTIAGFDHTAEQKWDTGPSATPTTLPYNSQPGVPLGTPVNDSQQPPTASNYQLPVPLSPASPVNTQQIPSPSVSPVSGAQSFHQQFGNVPPPPGPAPAGYTYALVPIQNAGSPPPQQQQQHSPASGQYAQPAAQYPQQGYGGQYGSQP